MCTHRPDLLRRRHHPPRRHRLTHSRHHNHRRACHHRARRRHHRRHHRRPLLHTLHHTSSGHFIKRPTAGLAMERLTSRGAALTRLAQMWPRARQRASACPAARALWPPPESQSRVGARPPSTCSNAPTGIKSTKCTSSSRPTRRHRHGHRHSRRTHQHPPHDPRSRRRRRRIRPDARRSLRLWPCSGARMAALTAGRVMVLRSWNRRGAR